MHFGFGFSMPTHIALVMALKSKAFSSALLTKMSPD